MKTIQEILAEEGASEARELEYLRESTKDDDIDYFMEKADTDDVNIDDVVDEYKDAKKIIDKMPEGDEYKTEEVERILQMNESITFDEMVGIEEGE